MQLYLVTVVGPLQERTGGGGHGGRSDRVGRSRTVDQLASARLPGTGARATGRTVVGSARVRRAGQPDAAAPVAGAQPDRRRGLRGPVPGAPGPAQRAVREPVRVLPDGHCGRVVVVVARPRAGGRGQEAADQAERGVLGALVTVQDRGSGRDARAAPVDAQRQPGARRRRRRGTVRDAQGRLLREGGGPAGLRADGPGRPSGGRRAGRQRHAGGAGRAAQRARVARLGGRGHGQAASEPRRRPGDGPVDVDQDGASGAPPRRQRHRDH